MDPDKAPAPEETFHIVDRKIGERLAKARKFRGYKQSELAELVGITRDRLANVETGRSALRFREGEQICGKLNVNQLWVAFEEWPMSPVLPLSERLLRANADWLTPSITFFEAYNNTVLAQEHRTFVRLTLQGDAESALKNILHDRYGDAIGAFVTFCVASIPDELRVELMAFLTAQAEGFWAKQVKTPQKKECQDILTPSDLPDMSSPMDPKGSPLWEGLRKRLVKTSTAPGSKTALAEFAGVSRQVVHQWLSGNSSPRAEQTLRVLLWVQDKERRILQDKKPSAVEAGPGKRPKQG